MITKNCLVEKIFSAFAGFILMMLCAVNAQAANGKQLFIPIIVDDIFVVIPILPTPGNVSLITDTSGPSNVYSITWEAVANAEYYQFEITDENGIKHIIETDQLNYTLADLPLGISSVELHACNSQDQCGASTLIGTYDTRVRIRYAHTDILGSPIMETDQAGNIISESHYKPYGETQEERREDIGYTGHLEDTDLDLTYMQARYYDPVLGRFYANDPVNYQEGNVYSFNRYGYANDNPYKYTDPDGRWAHIVAGAIAGGLISGVAYALTTDSFSAKDLAINVASGAAVGAVTAAVPGAIAAGSLNFGSKVANIAASGGNAVATGAAGNAATQAASTGNIDAGQALVGGVANAVGLGAGTLAAKPASALATTKIAGYPGLPVTSHSGKTFHVGKVDATSVTSEGLKQGTQDVIGESVTAKANCELNSGC